MNNDQYEVNKYLRNGRSMIATILHTLRNDRSASLRLINKLIEANNELLDRTFYYKRLITIDEAVQLYGLSHSAIYELTRSGLLGASMVGNDTLIRILEFENHLECARIEPDIRRYSGKYVN